MTDATNVLRQAVEVVRAQIPKGELTLASVERLLQAAEAVCADRPAPRVRTSKPSAQTSKRQEERKKWAKIARQNEKESRSDSSSSEQNAS